MKAVLTLAILTLVSLPAGALELKLKWQPGKRYVFKQDALSAVKMPLPGQGLVETKSTMVIGMTHDATVHEKGTNVRVAIDGISMKTEMAGAVIEYDSKDPAKSGGLLGPMMEPLAKAKYDAIFDDDGKLVEVLGLDKIQAPGQLGFGKAELEAMARQSEELMPHKDVNPGDRWDADVSLPMGGLGTDLALVYTLKLEGVEEQDGRKIARISLSGKMKEGVEEEGVEEEGVEEEGEAALAVEIKKITGEMLFDLDLGQPRELRTVVDLEMSPPAGIAVQEGAPGKMPVHSVSVQSLLSVEDIPGKAAE